MKVWLVLTITSWVILQQVDEAADITFDLATASKTKYGTFLSNLRNKVKDPKLVYEGIPMLPAPSSPTKYLFVELKTIKDGTSISITVAVSKNDLYVVAYTDQASGKLRAHYFSPDITDTVAKALFPTATEVIKINYKNTYKDLEDKANSKREDFQLGFENLKLYMANTYGKKTDDKDYVKNEAKFLLITVQMVAEAARFKYVESKAINNKIPDYKVPSLETNWEKISIGIRNAVKKVIRPPLELSDVNNGKWIVNEVDEIKLDMGLLKYVP